MFTTSPLSRNSTPRNPEKQTFWGESPDSHESSMTKEPKDKVGRATCGEAEENTMDISFTTEERPCPNDSPNLNMTLKNMDMKLLQKEIIILEKQIQEQKMRF